MADFDPAKDAINLSRHGISFARWVDMDIRAIVRAEPFDHGEPRYRAYGSIDGVLIAWFSQRVPIDIRRSAFGARMQRK
jgi:uncharacterized DUF497 family protein